jgi:uncharacterized protein (DUF433 family)
MSEVKIPWLMSVGPPEPSTAETGRIEWCLLKAGQSRKERRTDAETANCRRGVFADTPISTRMAVTKGRIVSGDDSEIHDEPHIEGSRVTVLHIHERVETRGLGPETVAERLGLDLADVYDALAYYHRNPEEMREVKEHRQTVAEESETLEKPE